MPRPLALLLTLAVLQSVAWNLATAPFAGPDEPAHFAIVQHLAETGSLPNPSSGASSYSTEMRAALTTLGLQATLGVVGGKPAWTGADLSLWHQEERALPRGASGNGSGPNQIAKNPPLYYAVMAIPYRVVSWLPLLKRLFALRLFNALFYLTTIALVWLIAGEVFGRVRWKQTLAAGVVTLQPQLASLSAVINADTLLVMLMTAVLLACVRLVKRGPSARRTLVASGLTAATLLTHGRGLVAVPVLLTALVASAVNHRAAVHGALKWVGAAAATVGAGFLAYVLFGRSGRGAVYGGAASSLNTGTSFNLRQFLSSIYQFYFPRLPDQTPRVGPDYGYRQVFINTFYGTFASLEVMFKQRIFDVLQIASGAGLMGFYTTAAVRWRSLLRSWPIVLVLLSLLVTNVVFLHYVSYRSLLGNGGSDPLIVGRYLLPMIALFGLAIAFTAGALPRRWGPLFGALILSAGAVLSLIGIGITTVRFYA